IGTLILKNAVARPDVLALVSITAGALSDQEIAQLTEIVAPRIGEVDGGGLVEHKRDVIDLAAVARVLGADPSRLAGAIAVAPRHEGLGLYVGRRVGDRIAEARIDGVVGAARHLLPAGVGDQIAGAVIGEVFGLFRRPREVELRLLDLARRAAGC